MRYISFIILLQIVCASTIFSQTSFVIDSIYIQQLKIKDTNVYNYLENELTKLNVKDIDDTLFLFFYKKGMGEKHRKYENEEYWGILGSENYNEELRTSKFAGYLQINNIIIMLEGDYGTCSKYMFEPTGIIHKFYYQRMKDVSVDFPTIYRIGSDVVLEYKVIRKKSNKFKFKKSIIQILGECVKK